MSRTFESRLIFGVDQDSLEALGYLVDGDLEYSTNEIWQDENDVKILGIHVPIDYGFTIEGLKQQEDELTKQFYKNWHMACRDHLGMSPPPPQPMWYNVLWSY